MSSCTSWKANNASGNRCGHDKDSPRFFERSSEFKRPPLAIEKALQNAEFYYFQEGDFLPNVAYSRFTQRQQRSESREAVASLVKVLIGHCDLESMQAIRFYNREKCLLSVNELAKFAGLHYKRCQRALKVLKEAGYVKLQYRAQRTSTGEIKPLIAIKRLTPRLFLDLGVTGELFRSCQNYIYKQIKRTTKKAKKGMFQVKKTLSNFRRTNAQTFIPIKQSNVQLEKQKVERLYQLKLQHPDWSTAQLRAAV